MLNSVRLPLLEELDTNLSPLTLFEVFRNEPFCFFLDSAADPQKLGHYSFMGSKPFLKFSSRGDVITLNSSGKISILKGNPFNILGRLLESYQLETKDVPFHFIGGAVGYFSYDLCHFIEYLPKTTLDDLQLPESYFGFYDIILAYDNLKNKAYIVSTGFPELDEGKRLKKAREQLDMLKINLICASDKVCEPVDRISTIGKVSLKGNFTQENYIKVVAKARQYIIDGDIFEVNISQRFEAEISTTPYELYRRLRRINPAPFRAYLDFNEVVIVSASPEKFLRVQDNLVETRPIKGTRRRGKTPQEDDVRANELVNSVKDNAENMMIVDLERNDLGRVCEYGTVKVTELAILEKFPTVFHLTSTVVGRLCEGKDRIDLLKAAFPGGRITGAPKIRSMEIIDKLEPTRRSVYTGSIGYLSFNGDMDSNIVIRTFLIKGNRAYFQVGGAVVYDSDPEDEYQETLDKGKALVDSLNTVIKDDSCN
jgi:para-aminobenzoate synthetase component I